MPAVLLDRRSQLNEPSVRRFYKAAAVSYTVGQLVYIESDNTVNIANSSTDVGPYEAVGMVKKVLDNFVYVQFNGAISIPTGSLTAGTEYFLGTTGSLTATAPTANGSYVQSVGYAESATRFILNIKDYSEN